MNDIEQKALALVNEIERERGEDELTPRIMRGLIIDEALCRAIERHEAERAALREVLERIVKRCETFESINLVGRSIKAKKGGTLRHVLQDARAALDAAGFEIREKNDDPAPIPVRKLRLGYLRLEY